MSAVLDAAALAARLGLVGVFLLSAAAKVADSAGSRTAAQQLGVPRALAGPVVVALPVGEVAVAVLIAAASPGLVAGAGLAVVMLAVFTLLLVRVLVRGERVACHCFGAVSDQLVGRATVLRNAGLLALAVLVLARSDGQPALLVLLGAGPAERAVLGAVLLGLLAVVGWLLLLLRGAQARAVGSAAPRPEAVRSVLRADEPEAAADVVLPDLDGVGVRLTDLFTDGRPALLVVVGAYCGLCDELLPDLQRWQGGSGPAHVVVVGTGPLEAVRDKAAAAPRLRVLVDEHGDVAATYGLTVSPAAMALTPRATPAGPAAFGVHAVRAAWAELPSTPALAAPVPAAGSAAAHQVGRAAGPGWSVPPDVVHVVDGDATLVTRAGSGVRQALPATAGAIWRLVVAGHDLPGIVTSLRADFPDAPHDLPEQVGALLDGLVAADLLRPRDPEVVR